MSQTRLTSTTGSLHYWLTAGLLFLVGAAVVIGVSVVGLSQPVSQPVATSGVGPARYVASLGVNDRLCQEVRVVRGRADRIRISVTSDTGGASSALRVSVNGDVVRRTVADDGYLIGDLGQSLGNGVHKVCLQNRGKAALLLAGDGPDVLSDPERKSIPGTYVLWVQLEDRSPDRWLDVMPSAIRRVGDTVGSTLGAASGWVALALLLVGLCVALLAVSAAAARCLRGPGPDTQEAANLNRLTSGRGALAVVWVVAGLSGAAWAILTPLFQVPDEPAHYAYVQYFAEKGALPGGSADLLPYSDEQAAAMNAVGSDALVGQPLNRVRESDPALERALDETTDLPRDNGGGRTGASPQPPLYYAAASVPYHLASWAPVPTRVLVLRLFSVALFAFTAVLIAVLAGELFPRLWWAPLVAGLAIGVQPMLGFVSAGATPEAFMDLVAAAFLLAAVRAIRKPSRRSAIAVGALAGAGVITKITLVGFVPAALLTLGIVAWRVKGTRGTREAALSTLLGAGALLVLPAAYIVWTMAVGRGVFPPGAAPPQLPPEQVPPATVREFLSYLWQLYLPRVPGQVDFFGFMPLQETWIYGWLGRYGWLDYGLSGWVREVGYYVVLGIGGLAVVGLLRERRSLWRARWEVLVFVVSAAGLAFVIAVGGYQYKRTTTLPFEQVRYLFPLAGLFALALVTAVIGTGRRLRPLAMWAVIVLASVHALTGPFLSLIRYYS